MIRALLRSRRGLAALEFALVLPVLLTLLAGATDLSLAVITMRRLTLSAQSVAVIASTMAIQTSNVDLMTSNQAWQATTAPFAFFPQWLSTAAPAQSSSASAASFSITLSDISFTANGNVYQAAVQWSVANPLGTVRLRPCGGQTPVPDDSTMTATTLPADVFGPNAILVADVSTVFSPIFSSVFLGSFQMSRQAYVSPREGTDTRLAGIGPGVTVVCQKAQS